MTTDCGRAPSGQALVASDEAPAGLHPSGFDPSRGDAEMLAILLWDFFGPNEPRTMEQVQRRSFAASERGIARYRECAEDIAASLRFYRNIQFDPAIAIEAQRAETTQIGSVEDESAGPQDIAQNTSEAR